MPMEKKIDTAVPFRILVICTGNRARSQMAHGWLQRLGGTEVRVSSAGTQPRGVHPVAVRVMAEVGIDISDHSSDHVDHYLDEDFDLVLTVCDAAREVCPVFPKAVRQLHHGFEDPDRAGLSEVELLPVFRRIRDQIERFCCQLLETELGRSPARSRTCGGPGTPSASEKAD